MKEINDSNEIEAVKEIANALDGQVETIGGPLSDGSGYAVISYSLPKTHWLMADGPTEPPMPLRMGTDNPEREKMANDIWVAAKYAIRASTMNGKAIDFDPDAMCQNFVVGLIGYWTPDGTSKL